MSGQGMNGEKSKIHFWDLPGLPNEPLVDDRVLLQSVTCLGGRKAGEGVLLSLPASVSFQSVV